mgnify:CR=1 FL=1
MEEKHPTITEAVAMVQRSVVVPKARYNAYAKFSYRSFEDIVAALKEPCKKAGIAFTLSDGVEHIGERYYVKATCRLFFEDGSGDAMEVSAYAREDEHKKGSDDAQVTGMASSYARQVRAVRSLRHRRAVRPSIPSRTAPTKEPPAQGPFVAKCKACGTSYRFESAGQYEQFRQNPGCCATPTWRVV